MLFPHSTQNQSEPHDFICFLTFLYSIFLLIAVRLSVHAESNAFNTATMMDGSTIEVGITGHEGTAGIPVVLGGTTGTHRAFVQIAGNALRLKATVLQAEFNQGGSLQKILLCYVQALFTQTSQSVACNRFHTTDERLARWLLLVADAVSRDEFSLTQEFIGQMLGVRRSGVTVAASNLARSGYICYRRGKIEIVNRPGLEDFSCECYGVIRNELFRLLRLEPQQPDEQPKIDPKS